MKVWLINPYGPIPGEGWRDYRFTMLGAELAHRGHIVSWWTANFSHHFKRFRSNDWLDRTVQPGFTICFVPTTSYWQNISLARLRFEVIYVHNLYRRALREQSPDIIIGTDPSQIVGYTCVRLAQRFSVPLILDVFDLWPELFVLAFPRALQPLAPVVLSPLRLLRRYNLRHADAITALCHTYLAVARRQVPDLPVARTLTVFNGIDVKEFRSYMPNPDQAKKLAQDLGKKPGEVWTIYAGSLGNNYDVRTMLEAAELLENTSSPIRLIIAGEGPLRPVVTEFIRQRAIRSISYLGNLNPETLAKWYSVCDIGLCAYAKGSNVAMPDKVYDYMAAGLPIVNSLPGELEQFLRQREIGLQYEAGNPISLANALQILSSDMDRRQTMAKNSFLAALEFDRRTQYERFADFIEALMLE